MVSGYIIDELYASMKLNPLTGMVVLVRLTVSQKLCPGAAVVSTTSSVSLVRNESAFASSTSWSSARALCPPKWTKLSDEFSRLDRFPNPVARHRAMKMSKTPVTAPLVNRPFSLDFFFMTPTPLPERCRPRLQVRVPL